MEVREGGVLKVNVVARNAAGRVLPTPADLVVEFNGAVIVPNVLTGAYELSTNGTLKATAGGVTVNEVVGIVVDNVVASLTFVQAEDGTQTPVDVAVGA